MSEGRVYGPKLGSMLGAVADMWDEHNERAQGVCGCSACATAAVFFEAACECGESKR